MGLTSIVIMKVAALLLFLVAAVSSAPQPRKDFHDHFEDFVSLIIDEQGHEIEHIFQHYMEFEEFVATIEYVKTANFKDLIYEMEALPQFQAVVEFLENDNIDITFFLNRLNDMLNGVLPERGNTRHELSGTNFSAFVQDCIDVFPSEKLAALFDQKMSEDEEFRVAIENLFSDEWNSVFTALWETPEFQKEVQTLEEQGLVAKVLLDEVLAIFGQNK